MRHTIIGLLVCLSAVWTQAAWAENAEVPAGQERGDPGFEVEFAPEAVGDDEPEEADAGVVNFTGRLLERGTRAPVGSVTVYIKDTSFEADSDEQGRFAFRDLPPGEYTVVIPTPAFELFETRIRIRKDELTEATLYLDPKSYGGLEVVVRGSRVKKEVSRKVLKIEEIGVVPGTNGDAVKVVQNMPGVARTAGGLAPGGLVIRGSSPEDSLVLLDGHRIPNLFHFGGLKSTYNSDLLEQVDLSTGAYGVQNGGATGGLVELKTRKPRQDRWGGYIDSSLIDASALAEGPLSPDMGLAMAVRRSTLDLALPLVFENSDDVAFIALPVYYDYQAKWDYRIDARNSVTIDAYGSYDELSLASEKTDDAEPEVDGFGMESMAHVAFITHRYENDWFESSFSPGFAYVSNRMEFGDDYYFDSKTEVISIREDMRFKLSKNNTLLAGASLLSFWGKLTGNIIRPPKEGDDNVSFANDDVFRLDISGTDSLIGLYLADEMRFGPVLLVPGLRLDYDTLLDAVALGPALSVRWTVVEPLVLKTGVGLYHRVPDADEMWEPIGNEGLDFERALHVLVGAEWAITDTIHLEANAFYKKMDHLVSRVQDPDSDKAYENGASGEAYGGELLLRHDWTEHLFGWVSYSISRSHRNDGPGTPYRLFARDQTHNLVAMASWEFAKTWRLGLRFQYTTGEPYSRVAGSVLNADNGTYVPVYDQQHKRSERRDAYHTLDVRLDKSWVFDTWVLNTYIDVQNAYYRFNEIDTVHNYDFSEKKQLSGLPILPSIGIKAEF